MIDNDAVLLLPQLFKSNSVDWMYEVEKEPTTNLPNTSFLGQLVAIKTPRCRITLDLVEVLVAEGGLDYIPILACLVCIYYIYSIKYPNKL